MKNLLLVLTVLIGNTAFAGACLELNGRYEEVLSESKVKAGAKPDTLELATYIVNEKYNYIVNGRTFVADGIDRKESAGGSVGKIKVTCTEDAFVLVTKDEEAQDGVAFTIVQLSAAKITMSNSFLKKSTTFVKKSADKQSAEQKH